MFELTQRMLRATTALQFATLQWETAVLIERGQLQDTGDTPTSDVSTAAMIVAQNEVTEVIARMKKFR